MALLTGFKSNMAKKAVTAKLENLHENCSYTHWWYDSLVFNKMKSVMGGRVRLMMTASAPISSETLDFLKIAFCCPILEAYG